MRQRDDARATLLRYVAFQVAGALGLFGALWILHELLGLAWWVIVLVMVLSILKDIVLYPKLRDAYRPRPARTGGETLAGRRGVATTALEPTGWVRLGGEVWRARLEPGSARLTAGSAVIVRSVEGLTLVVSPASADED